jgi:trigger factor
MLHEIKEVTPTTKRITINIPADVVKAEFDSSYNKLRSVARIPGFRQGKAPQAILEKRFGKDVEAEVIQKIVPEYYSKAISEAHIDPVGYPDIEGGVEIKPGQPLSLTFVVEVKPDIGEMKYEGIVLDRKTASVDDEEIERAVKTLQESKVLYSVTEEAIKEGDLAVIYGDAFIEGEKREELSYKEYPFIHGSEAVPAEFSKEVLGRKKGEEFEVKLNFEKDHPNKTIAGKEILFKVKLTETKKRNVPPLDDEFAKEFECKDMEELRKKVRDNITERKESEINLGYKKEILNRLIKDHDFEVPASMLKAEIDTFIEQLNESAAKRNEAIRQEEDIRKEYEETARGNVKSVLILEAIGKKENITVNEEDVKKALNEISARHNLKPEEVMKIYSVREGSLDALKSRLFGDKVLEFLLGKSVIQEKA